MIWFWPVSIPFLALAITAQPTCQGNECPRDILKPKCIDTPKPHGAIYYNDFECTLPEVDDLDADASYGLVSPGFTGKKALGGWITRPRVPTDHVTAIWAYFNDIPIKKHVPARLSLDGHFLNADAGEIKIVADGLFTEYFFAPIDSPKWAPFSVDFTSKNDTISFSIGFGFSTDNARIRFDNLLLEYVH